MFSKGLLSEGVQSAAWMEKTQVEMKVMLGSMEETQKVLKDLTQYAIETPFKMPQLVTVAKQMILAGDKGDKLMETIKMLGESSGGSSEKFALLGLVFNQIRGVGHLVTQDFRQLSTRGIISLQDLAKYYGVTESAADKMLSTGKIKFEDFRKMLISLTKEGGRYHGMMKETSVTFEGLQSTLEDNVNILKRLIAQPLMEYLKLAQTAAINLSGAMSNFVQWGGKGVSMAFVGATAFASLAAAITSATFAARLFGLTMKGMLIGSGIGISIVLLGAAVGFLVGKFNLIERAVDLWNRLATVVSRSLKPAFDVLAQTWITLQNEAEVIFRKILIAIAPLLEQVGIIGNKWDDVASSVESVISRWAKKIAEFVQGFTEYAIAIVQVWQENWDKMPLVVAAAASAVRDIIDNLKTYLTAKFNEMTAPIFAVVDAVVNKVLIGAAAVSNALRAALQYLVYSVSFQVRVLTTIFTTITDGVTMASSGIEGIVAPFQRVFTTLVSIVNSAAAMIRRAITDMMEYVFGKIQAIYSKMIGLASTAIKFLPTMNPFKKELEDAKKDAENFGQVWKPAQAPIPNAIRKAIGPSGAAAEAANRARNFGNVGNLSNFTKALSNVAGISGMMNRINDIKKQLEAQRSSLVPVDLKDMFGTKAAEKPKPKVDELLKPGMTEIDKFGSKLQETLLHKEDGVMKTNEILGEHTEIQKKQLEAQQGMAAGLKEGFGLARGPEGR